MGMPNYVSMMQPIGRKTSASQKPIKEDQELNTMSNQNQQ
jgi:hypothetical protein